MGAYWRLVGTQFVHSVPKGLMAQSTVFGWVLSGAYSTDRMLVKLVICCALMAGLRVLPTFYDFYESVGISENDSAYDPVLSELPQSIEIIEGRYVVPFPWNLDWKGNYWTLDEWVGRARLFHLEKNVSLKERYDETIYDTWNACITKELPFDDIKVKDEPVFYMPQGPVVKENRLTAKVRLVFDAYCKGYNGISLNNCLNIGPNLLSYMDLVMPCQKGYSACVYINAKLIDGSTVTSLA